MMGKYWSKPPRLSSWRKISVGMWKTPSNPSIYGCETVDVDALLDYLDEVSQASGEKVSLTAHMVKVVARRAVRMSMTWDHRCFDGYQVGQFVRSVRGALNNPRDFYPAPEHWKKAAPGQSETEPAAAPADKARGSQKSNKRTPEATTKIG